MRLQQLASGHSLDPWPRAGTSRRGGGKLSNNYRGRSTQRVIQNVGSEIVKPVISRIRRTFIAADQLNTSRGSSL
jgi:hypothetical protein